MELNRNHYFMVGVVFVLLGLQFRMVQSVVLNEKAAEFLNQQFGDGPQLTTTSTFSVGLFSSTPPLKRTLQPPRWLGLSLISIGVVLMLHSLAMKKPGG